MLKEEYKEYLRVQHGAAPQGVAVAVAVAEVAAEAGRLRGWAWGEAPELYL